MNGQVLAEIKLEGVAVPYYEVEQNYWCPVHQAWFRRAKVECLVVHPLGTCCHEYEEMVQGPPIVPAMRKAMTELVEERRREEIPG